MGIFSSMFGGKKNPEPFELSKQAGEFLTSMEKLLYMENNWKAALKLYRKNSIYDKVIGEGGDMEQQFFKVAFDLLTKERENEKQAILQNPEDIRKFLSETQKIIWDENLESVDDLCGKTDFSKQGLLWLTIERVEMHVDPLKRVNVMYCFAAQPDAVLVLLYEGIPMVVRKSFLKQAVEEELDADLQIEDLGQELMDFARSKKLGIYNFWGR